MSGPGLIMPNGTAGPGNTLPPPATPSSGSILAQDRRHVGRAAQAQAEELAQGQAVIERKISRSSPLSIDTSINKFRESAPCARAVGIVVAAEVLVQQLLLSIHAGNQRHHQQGH